MAKIFTVILVILMLFLDYRAYGKLQKASASKRIRYPFIGIVALSYLMVILTPLFMFLFLNEENNAFMMVFSMSILTFFLAVSAARLVLYAFWLPAKKVKWVRCGIVFSSLVLLYSLYCIFVTRTDYSVERVEVEYEELPEQFDGYRIAFLSDMHIGSMPDAVAQLNEVSSIINSLDADLVLFGGDMVNIYSSELSPEIASVLATVKAKDGIFAVLGNHDTGSYISGSDTDSRIVNKNDFERRLNAAGWTLLRDSTVYIKRESDSIAVTGIDYTEKLLEYKHKFDAITDIDYSSLYESSPEGIFNITVSHLPQLWHYLCDNGYSDLTLSGHIHAMQCKIGSFSPASFMYDEYSGLYTDKNGKLYINDGIGSVGFIARIGSGPEITLIELKSKRKSL